VLSEVRSSCKHIRGQTEATVFRDGVNSAVPFYRAERL
jgi:hypothetical protein